MADSPRRQVPSSVRMADHIAGIVLGVGGSFAPFALVAAMVWLFWQADLMHPFSDWSRVWGWLRGSISLGLVALCGSAPFAIAGALLGRGNAFAKLHLRMAAAVPFAVPAFLLLHWTGPWASQTFGVPVQHPFWACLALSIGMIPPLWLILSDALERGEGIAAAAYALGATPSQVMRSLILPASVPGLVAALLRGLSRALGETMAVLLVSGNYASAWGGASGAASVGAAFVLDLPEARPGGLLWIDLMRGGLLLCILTVFVYALSDRIERKFRPRGLA
jgi:phosphate transport system permease protein